MIDLGKVRAQLQWLEQQSVDQYKRMSRSLPTQWTEEVPATPVEGHSWYTINIKGMSYHCFKATGELYSETTPILELIKAVTIYNYAHWFFALHCINSVIQEIGESAKPCYEMFNNYVLSKDDPNFTWKTFSENHRVYFKDSGNQLGQAAKFFALFAFFYSDPTVYGVSLGTLGRTVAIGYALAYPLSVRIGLNRFERWWLGQENKPLEKLSWAQQMAYLSHIFGMQCVGQQSTQRPLT